MDDLKIFELKVGVFIMIGVAILFIIVFSIGDINIVKKGYHIKVDFNFVDGIGGSAPVRVSGIGVGQIDGLKLYYDENEKKTKAQLNAWVREGVKIEEDAVATISTLGFMGEKYMEISPGTPGKRFLKNGDLLVGKDPISMAKVFENLSGLTDSVKVIVDRLKNGEGTIGKLLTKDKIYKDLEAFVEDIKNNPWKLLNKPRGQ
ncbi:MAG: MlaD family protein [Candidatus Omnitrophota bacterium]|nr:MlaD family protein [Candidatus Omnitrophota bacterium]